MPFEKNNPTRFQVKGNEPKKQNINIRIEPGFLAQCKEAAKNAGIDNFSAFVIEALEEKLNSFSSGDVNHL